MNVGYPATNQEIQPMLSFLALGVQQLHHLHNGDDDCNDHSDYGDDNWTMEIDKVLLLLVDCSLIFLT